MIPMGATEIVAAYNDFRNNIVYLQVRVERLLQCYAVPPRARVPYPMKNARNLRNSAVI